MTARRARKKWSVLLAEDNDDHAMLIGMALERATRVPVEVHRARNGDEAVQLAEEIHPDLILLDLKMPGRSGHEVLHALKADDELRRIPISVLTSSDRDDDIARSYGLGGNHFLTKPENPMELEEKLRALLSNAEELSRIRRGAGRLAATAATAFGPGDLETRQLGRWVAVGATVLFLTGFAWVMGVL